MRRTRSGAAFLSADAAAALVPDGALIAFAASGGGLLEGDALYAGLEARFLADGHPRDLTLVHALGIGDGRSRGLNRFAHRGMVSRVIGGHWSWSPPMQELARDGAIAAYALPAGVIGAMLRESGAGRPGLISRVGLGTFVDPRLEGGRLNHTATEDLVRVVELAGVEYLHYLPLRVDVALIRASVADERGNLSFENEPCRLDSVEAALAARGNGGLVIAQVKRVVRTGDIDPRLVHIPSPLVDVVVEAPQQWQTYAAEYDPTFMGCQAGFPTALGSVTSLDARTIVARRAALEIAEGATVNVGYGMSAGVVEVMRAQGRLDSVDLCVEQGAVGGIPENGDLFGVARHPLAIVPSAQQFDSFASGMLDICVLGMGEVDPAGNVNVSKLGGHAVGPGGFIDIVEGARRAIFCGTLTARGLKVRVDEGRLSILHEGAIPKFVRTLEQITYAAQRARVNGHSALYITERAVFESCQSGLRLIEVAPGIDAERDVLARCEFEPEVGDLREMPGVVFSELDPLQHSRVDQAAEETA